MSFVKEMALDLKDDLIDGSWAERVLASLIISAVIMLIALSSYMTFYIADSVSTETFTDNGIVVQKTYQPPYIYNLVVGEVIVLQSSSARFILTLKLKDSYGFIDVNQEFYNYINSGESLETTYGYGRISRSLYVKSVIKR